MHSSPLPHSLMTAVLALGLLPTACDQDLGDEELAAQEDEDVVLDDDESRLLCFYNTNSPPTTNDSDTLIGANDEVESEDEANGGCDLHMFRVTAQPPGDRARTIQFHASSLQPFDDFGGLVWTKSCAGAICALNWSTSSVSFTQSGGGCVVFMEECLPLLHHIDGEITLSASNSIVDIRAGMRATDDDGNTVPVTITVSE